LRVIVIVTLIRFVCFGLCNKEFDNYELSKESNQLIRCYLDSAYTATIIIFTLDAKKGLSSRQDSKD